MPFVAPKGSSATTSSGGGPGGAGRTTFRPPWVKDDGAVSPLKSAVKTSTPWAKKTAAERENGEKPTTTATAAAATTAPTTTSAVKKATPTTKTAAPSETANTNSTKKPIVSTSALKKPAEPAKKVVEPPKKIVEPVKKTFAPPPAIKKATPEPIKRTAVTPASKTVAAKKKEPTPPASSEEEESEEESEEETEDESEESEEESEEETEEEDTPPAPPAPAPAPIIKPALKKGPTTIGNNSKPAQPLKKEEEESELKRRFSIEKPKLRPVMTVKRDKSMKKIEDDDEAVEGETEEERERRLRFKLEKPKLRHVKREEKPIPCKSTDNMVLKTRPTLKKVPKIDEVIKEPQEDAKPEFKTKTLRKTPSIKREMSIKNVPAPPPLPSLVPKAPPPPPPPSLGPAGEKRELTPTQKAALDKLKIRPRRRPDWSVMMKEVESGRKLRHVECNDRSQPILTCKSMTKVDDKFIYETEKDKPHNKLLKQIQVGMRLKPTKTNDRSKPFIEGLRKFRRQMTIEEQLQKSQSKINLVGAAPASDSSSTATLVAALSIEDPSGDELDDIDKIRDDLQSTKQMLAFELRNREAQDRENKKLLAKIATLEAELKREKSRETNLEYGSNVIVATHDATPASEEAFVNSLKQEAEDARKVSKDLEKRYHDTGELLDTAKSEIEEQKHQIQMLERKLAQALQGGGTLNTNSRRPSDARTGRDSSPEFDLELTESDPDEPEEKKAERHERRLVKEVKVLRSKLTKLKVKQEAAKKEKIALKQTMKKNHVILKEENKKFKKLEKEVHKMAASMKNEDEDEEADEDEEEEETKEEAESEEESDDDSEESESEESDAATESESEAEDATSTDKKQNLEPRVKKHESRLSALKKCNVLLQANVDNLQDEITQTRVKAASLQTELDNVLADLGF